MLIGCFSPRDSSGMAVRYRDFSPSVLDDYLDEHWASGVPFHCSGLHIWPVTAYLRLRSWHLQPQVYYIWLRVNPTITTKMSGANSPEILKAYDSVSAWYWRKNLSWNEVSLCLTKLLHQIVPLCVTVTHSLISPWRFALTKRRRTGYWCKLSRFEDQYSS